MYRLSIAFVTLLTTACTTEVAPIASRPDRAEIPGSDVLTPRVSRPDVDPGCIPGDDSVVQYGTTQHDGFRDVAINAAGDILVAGYQGGHEGADGTITGSRGVVLGYTGDFIPRGLIDTVGTDAVESLAIARDTGRVWLAARTNAALPGLSSYGGFDVVLAELGGDGARPIARGFDSTPEYPRQIAAAGDVIAIAGHKERLVLDGSTWVNPFLSVYDARSEVPTNQWFVTRHTSMLETYTAVDASADMIATAGAIAIGDEQGTYIVARDHDADLLWQQQLSGIGGDSVAAVRIVPGGDVVWAGTSGGDIIVGRLDGATGAPRWSVRHGDDNDERVADLAVDAGGNIFLAGTLTALDSDQGDVMMLVLDEEGRPLVQEVWSSEGDDVATAIALDACDTAVIVGHTTGDLGGVSRGGDDGFMVVTSGPAEAKR